MISFWNFCLLCEIMLVDDVEIYNGTWMISFDENTKVKKQSFVNHLQLEMYKTTPIQVVFFLFVGHAADLPCDK